MTRRDTHLDAMPVVTDQGHVIGMVRHASDADGVVAVHDKLSSGVGESP